MNLTADEVTRAACQEVARCLDACMEIIEHCVDQLSDQQIWWRPTASNNAIGNLMLHLSGNIRQWIVAGIGGASDGRDRPAEFAERGPIDRETLLRQLQQAADDAKSVLARAGPEQMLTERRIQGMKVTGWGAIFDSIPHFKGHTQEIVCLTRIQLGDRYQFRWVPQTPEEGAPCNDP